MGHCTVIFAFVRYVVTVPRRPWQSDRAGSLGSWPVLDACYLTLSPTDCEFVSFFADFFWFSKQQ